MAASFFDGFNHLPDIVTDVRLSPPGVALTRTYPQLRMYGGEAALPTTWFTIKGEAAWTTKAESRCAAWK